MVVDIDGEFDVVSRLVTYQTEPVEKSAIHVNERAMRLPTTSCER
jgi:hypothetical protein